MDILIFIILLSTEDQSSGKQIYEAIKEGDEKAFKVFFDEHYDALYIFLRNRSVRRDVAEDLIQKAFVYIWENRQNIKPHLSLKAYLFRIAYTRMLNHFDQKKDFLDLEKQTNGISTTPHDSAEFNDLREAFHKAIEEMPEKRRLVFESCFLQDLTYKETAKIMSISVKTVENHMALAFKDLRKALKIFKEI